MRCFGARGYVSPEALKRSALVIKAMRKEQALKRRAEIKLLSDKDITIMAAGVIVDTVGKGRAVVERDFDNVGLPLDRVRNLQTKAMAAARKIEPRIDAMLQAVVAA